MSIEEPTSQIVSSASAIWDALAPLPRGIIVVATPLGNIGDASFRLIQALAQGDVIAAEDTRRTRALAAALGVEISGKVVSNFDHNESERAHYLVDLARTQSVVVITDAGMPIVSDPGFPLVEAAHEAGVPVTCFPGPSAVPTALALSGLHVGHFAFDGFAPRKQGQRRAWLESLKNEKRSVCFFESPHRIADTLAAAAEILGDHRRAAVTRELTKTYEEVKRGGLRELAQWASAGVKGEISVVIEGARHIEVRDVRELVDPVENLVCAGRRLKEASAVVAQEHGVSKKELYDAVLESRGRA
ncbi:16S rRNA (cytidine(1402)-2'-O)-methyltransferase [Corynebacterium pseudotuberculosis]|uniref:Ribosomal RNA small subunit methyltransferase I n=1 Tax=Corynebacterium pseudotuberculosis (strain C231) TaxID=681645 RepID=D9Q9D4_CORP2|nr:16S rRNA (cytidine(1402)-2'-O)-methyltransferase [Corynebacterium pseudotuberculosis]ADK28470.1 16S rRNA (cytidine(1402)-2'-O)-methyltransferase [Corynebacterium pseudotuberculosis FRC41]ADL10160.1 16S rRNA (cytidine(1402)-2'-O)-methyltransferase [Corynebacterium pseudotuberculosis C231]ADL20571.2 16S rRNA (cytidine(1402)-2'-O)-methyltransferase [Corynebacterium pseudotuberculosis 1002]ADO25952.3 16S rRNA (cytidine(1402)-2'-O)-methyltransferase [Corynebacterium pseudotuberculosis I19]AEK920